jgi:uncharacterized membrane protein
MIVYENGVDTVKTNDVLCYSTKAVRNLAIMLMVNAAEANTDMVLDMSHEYRTKDEVEAVFNNLNEIALDALADHIDDLRASLEKFLREVKFTARVRRMEYEADGSLSDVLVELEVK